MRNGQFSTEQIIRILGLIECEEQPISALCRGHAILDATFYR